MAANPSSSRPIRVLYIARAPFVSGAERALISTLRYLDRNRIEPTLVLGCDSPLVAAAGQLAVPVKVIGLPKRSRKNPVGWWRSVRRLDRFVKEVKPDLMHANDVPSCQAMSVIGDRRNIPRVLHIRWGITAIDAGWWAYRGVEQVLCISQWVRDELGDTRQTPLGSARIDLLADSVDWPAEIDTGRANSHSPHVGERESVRTEAVGGGQSEEDRREGLHLGFAGQLIESKGLDLVIEAMGRCPAERRPRLLVAGQDTQTAGVYQRELQELAKRCGVEEDIDWLGFLDDVSRLYRQVDAVVCPSRVEPLGLVPLEAARYHLPAMANHVGGLAETIRHGVTGLLVEPTVESWADALAGVGDGKQLVAMGRAAYEHTVSIYSPRQYQATLMEIYDDLLSNRRR